MAAYILYYRLMRAVIKSIGIYIGVSVFLGLLWIIFSYPDIPSVAISLLWILAFVVLVFPLQVTVEILGEMLVELLRQNQATRFVKHNTAAKSFSLLRIFYAVVLVLIFFGVVSGAGYGLNRLLT